MMMSGTLFVMSYMLWWRHIPPPIVLGAYSLSTQNQKQRLLRSGIFNFFNWCHEITGWCSRLAYSEQKNHKCWGHVVLHACRGLNLGLLGEKSKSKAFFVFIFWPKWWGRIGKFTGNVRIRPPHRQDYGPRSGRRGKVSEIGYWSLIWVCDY